MESTQMIHSPRDHTVASGGCMIRVVRFAKSARRRITYWRGPKKGIDLGTWGTAFAVLLVSYIILAIILKLFNPPLLLNTEDICHYETWLTEYKQIQSRVVEAMKSDCAGYWETLRREQAGKQVNKLHAWWMRDETTMPGFMVISCGLEGELDCHGFGDLSNAAVGALFYAVQTRRALFINTGKPHVYDFLESSQLEWGFVGAVAECAMNGAPKLKKSESPLIRFTDESKGDTAFGQTFPLSSWLDFFWLHLGLFHRDITLNEGVLLPPALVITSYNVLSEYRFMLAFYGEPRVSMSVSKDDYRYVFTYGCLLRTLFERPTQKMYKHVAEPMEIMTRADVSVAVHIRFGDALMDKDISEFIPGPADRRVKVDRSGVDPYCVCGWNFVEQTLRGKTIVDKRDTVISDSTTEFKAFDSSSDGALDIAVFTLADSSRGVKLIKDYFLEKHARSAVWNPIAAKKFTDKDFGKGGKWMPDDKTTQTQHNTSKDQESKQSNVLVFNTAGAPKHVAVDTDMESDIKAMADWLIASSADFVVTSRSGFSFSASAKSLHPAVTLFQCWIHNFYLH